jgi:signal transduction histidine kinase
VDSARGRPRRIAIRSVPEEGERILLEVTDSGTGMTPQDVHHVFDAFHTTKAKGTGIGLSLCRTIVEEHGGRIWASPGEKAGATFHVQLPRQRFTGSARTSSA